MKQTTDEGITLLRFDGLCKVANLSHFISTRVGGVSSGAYSSLNVGEYCDDEPQSVAINCERLCGVLNISSENLFVPHQIHEDHILSLDASFIDLPPTRQQEVLHGVDAIITNIPDIYIGITTADCVPVLLYSPDKRIVAAIHAGWRGCVKQIVTKTIRQMTASFGCDTKLIQAGIGPSISKAAYEIGEEIVCAFASTGLEINKIASRHLQTGRWHLDLWEIVRIELMQAGVLTKHIELAKMCTFQEEEIFFSARRQGIKSGRMISGIALKS